MFPSNNIVGLMIPRYLKYKMLNKVLQDIDSSLKNMISCLKSLKNAMHMLTVSLIVAKHNKALFCNSHVMGLLQPKWKFQTA
ncbi:MAG: hypothetical protein ACI93H_001747 [Psychromonas sp.]|jgi:hypothetical protein